MKKNLILSVLFLLAIFASCSKETTYSITNATGSLIAVRVHEYDDKDKPIKIQEETVLSTSPITFIAHEKAETIKIYITKALSQYGSMRTYGYNKFTIWTIPNLSQSMEIPLWATSSLNNKTEKDLSFSVLLFFNFVR